MTYGRAQTQRCIGSRVQHHGRVGEITATSGQAGRSIRLLGGLIRGGLRDPGFAARSMRDAMSEMLDRQFEHESPLRVLPRDYRESIYKHEITLPPQRLLLPGNQSLTGLVFLVSLGRSLDARSVFEIGTYNGLTAWSLARNLHTATVYTLDMPADQTPELPLFVGDRGHRVRFERHAYDLLLHEGEVVQEWGDSARFDFSPWRGTCDMVYVDGAHSPEYVASDTRNAFDMLSPTGAIVWDDYWRGVPGVSAVLDGIRHAELLKVPGTRLVVHLSRGAKERLAALEPAG